MGADTAKDLAAGAMGGVAQVIIGRQSSDMKTRPRAINALYLRRAYCEQALSNSFGNLSRSAFWYAAIFACKFGYF